MSTPKLNLPKISGNMTADVVRDLNALADAVDANAAKATELASHKAEEATETELGHIRLSDIPNPTKESIGLGNVDNVKQIPLSQKGVANGVASLGSDGKVPSGQLPSLSVSQDDVLFSPSANNDYNSKIVEWSDTTKSKTVAVSTFTKTVEAELNMGGIITVSFAAANTASGKTAYGNIYVNDQPVGTQRTITYYGSYPTAFTEDIQVSAGDKVSIYLSRGSASVYLTEFGISKLSDGRMIIT